MCSRANREHLFEKKFAMDQARCPNRSNTDPKRNNCITGYGIYKLACVMHALVFADGALEAKNAQVMGHNQNFEGGTERKKSEPNEPRDDKSEQK